MASEAMSAYVRFWVKDEVSGDAAKVEDAGQKAAKGLDDAADAGGSKFSSAMKTAGNVAKTAAAGIAAIGAAGAAAVGGLMNFAVGQQEMIEEMGKLDTAFTTNGHTVERARDTYKNFYGLIGEEDTAVEAAQNLARLTTNQEELDQWTNITAGAFAQFGDALPIENLTETAQESAHTGQVVGSLADALNWTTKSNEDFSAAMDGHSKAQAAFNKEISAGATKEDAFNAALAACSDEQERSSLITSTLNGLYGEAGEEYQKQNEALIKARQGQAEYGMALAEVGKALQPMVGSIYSVGGAILNSMVPAFEKAGEGLAKMFNGDEGGAEEFTEGITEALTAGAQKVAEVAPVFIQAGVGVLQGLVVGLLSALPTLVEGILGMVPTLIDSTTQLIGQVAQAIAEMLPGLISTLLLSILDIGTAIVNNIPVLLESLMGAVTTLINGLVEMLPTLIPALVVGVVGLIQAIAEALPQMVDVLIEGVTSIIQAIVDMLPTLVPILLEAAIMLFMALVDALPQIVDSLISGAQALIDSVITMLPTLIPALLSAAVQLFLALVQALPQILPQLLGAITSLIGQGVKLLPTFIGALLEAAVTLFMSIAKAIPEILPDVLGAIGDLLAELPGKVMDFAGDMGSAAFDMIMGMVNGIGDAAQWVVDKLGELCGNALDAVKNFFGIGSPSKEFRAMFRWIPIGGAEGIEDEADVPVKALFDMGRRMDIAAASIGTASNIGAGYGIGGAVSRAVENVTNINVETGETDPVKLARMIADEQRRNTYALGAI